MLPLLKAHSFYQITKGQMSVWSTPWCNGWANLYDALIIQSSNYSYLAQVKDLWLPNQQTWNTQFIDTLFQSPMAESIKSTPIIHSTDEDMLCWKLTPTGKCNTKSAYKACLQHLQENGEPKPREVDPSIVQLLKKIWENKQVIPRIQTFGWRFLRKALPTGARAGKYSKHISKLCCRCDLEETDYHLFFTCNYARAAWFSHPWYIRVDMLITNANSLTDIILNLVNMNHPNATLPNVLTFMWCLWKSRNDHLFNRQQLHPAQIQHMANALNHNLEMSDVLQVSKLKKHVQITRSNMQEQGEDMQVTGNQLPPQGHTLRTDLMIKGTKVFTDAAWKTKKAPGLPSATGIGIFIQVQEDDRSAMVMIQASIPTAPSVLQAEAEALLAAARITSALHLRGHTFLMDSIILASATATDLRTLE
jgi:hypothetical protein